jgi:hypothetical protein
MFEIVDSHLKKRADELMLDHMPRNEDIMKEIFEFNVRDLDATSSLKISQFVMGLSQFIIYFGYQVNKTRVSLMQKRDAIESYISKSDIKGRTKAERKQKVIDANPELKQIELSIKIAEQELALVENREKYLLELINSFKRELTRRENEMKMVRTERRLS